MKKVGIICAGDQELEPFLPHIQNYEVTKKAMLSFYQGTIHEVDIVALFSGVCKTNAAIATQILIDHFHVDAVINAGTAGGMAREIKVLDTVIATEVAYHDVQEDILTEFHPWMETIYFKADDALLVLLKKIAARTHQESKIHFGRMITGEAFITDEGRDDICAAYNPLSVDMETASIAHVCYVNQKPFAAVRSITDTAEHRGIDNFEANCATAAIISKNIVLALLNEIRKSS